MKIKKRIFTLTYILLFLFAAFNATAKTEPDDTGNGTLSGIVTDKADSTVVPGATVSIPDLKIATATND
jgi:iron complex outermembrane receptor protein